MTGYFGVTGKAFSLLENVTLETLTGTLGRNPGRHFTFDSLIVSVPASISL